MAASSALLAAISYATYRLPVSCISAICRSCSPKVSIEEIVVLRLFIGIGMASGVAAGEWRAHRCQIIKKHLYQWYLGSKCAGLGGDASMLARKWPAERGYGTRAVYCERA